MRANSRVLSLRWRLWLAGAGGVLAAALLAGWLLGAAFERAAQRALDQRLDDDFATLAALVEATPEGGWQLRRAPADERYARIFSGWYWQVGAGDALQPSRSLWDERIAPAQVMRGPAQWRHATGPRDQRLRVREQALRLPGVTAPVQVLVAGDRADVVAEARDFRVLSMLAVAGVAAALLAVLAWQVEWGLRPLRRMRRTLAQVRQGEDVRFGAADWPAEAAPLARQIDELLDEHARRVARARHAAQDLAHELKTPLAVLAAESERPGPALAGVVSEQVQRMRVAVDRRLAAGFGADPRRRTPLAGVVTALCRLFEAPARARVVGLVHDVPAHLVFGGAAEDLEEMLGNLIDNAVKWARSQVQVTAREAAGHLQVEVIDDGPGIATHTLSHVIARGVRLDEQVPGSGIGLSIVDSIASSYDGTLELANLPEGFRARLSFPAVPGPVTDD